MSDEKKVVIGLIGHCMPDAFALTSAIRGFIPGADVRRINKQKKLDEAMGEISLLVVNRVLDGRFASEGGIEFIRDLGEGAPPAMLITNFAEHMEESMKVGAVMGFGKSTMRSAEAESALKNALSIGTSNG